VHRYCRYPEVLLDRSIWTQENIVAADQITIGFDSSASTDQSAWVASIFGFDISGAHGDGGTTPDNGGSGGDGGTRLD
jgi:hypothetical protein